MKISNTHNTMKTEQHNLNNVPSPEDFEQGVLTRTFLAQLPFVDVPNGFENAVMNSIASDIRGSTSGTYGLGQFFRIFRNNTTLAISVTVAFVAVSLWVGASLLQSEIPHTQTSKKIGMPKVQSSANTHTLPAVSVQQSSAKQSKSLSPARPYHTSQKMIKNDTSPIPGFKAESKGEHEED
jgi:hypothetical protein